MSTFASSTVAHTSSVDSPHLSTSVAPTARSLFFLPLVLYCIGCCPHRGVSFSNFIWMRQIDPLYTLYQKDDTLLFRYREIGKSTNWHVVEYDSLYYLNPENGSLRYYRTVDEVDLGSYTLHRSDSLLVPTWRRRIVGDYHLAGVFDRPGFNYHNLYSFSRPFYRAKEEHISFEDSTGRRYLVPIDNCAIWGVLNMYLIGDRKVLLFFSPQERLGEGGDTYALVNLDSLLYLSKENRSRYPVWPADKK